MKMIVRASRLIARPSAGCRHVFVVTGLLGLATIGAIIRAADSTAQSPPQNLLTNGDFSNPKSWQLFGEGKRYQFLPHGGRTGACLEYHESGQPQKDTPAHVDQIVALTPHTQYAAGVWVRGDGILRPTLRIASEDWQTIALITAEPSKDWQRIELAFSTGQEQQVRFQLFARQRSDASKPAAGRATFDTADLHQATVAEAAALRRCRVEVASEAGTRQVNPLFFGVNTLFWIEDPAAIQDGTIARRLKELPCRLMRFPGGTAAENYHWKTGTLDDPRHYPYRGGPDTLTTDAFMKLCRQVGAEPIFVVNLQTSYLQGHLEQGIREATDWVHYCNRENDYRVHYWEIGNEQYLLTHMGARQYAEAFVRFARAMKQVDPTILIGAVGPERIDSAGAADRIPPEAARKLESMSDANRQVAMKQLNQAHRTGPAWWPIVLEVAGADLDLAVVHRYFPLDPSKPLDMDQHVAKLRSLLDASQPNRKIQIALTEWNVSKSAKLSNMDLALGQSEAALRFISGGVDMATFWPLRFTGGDWGHLSLLDLKTNAPLPGYELLQLLATRLSGGTILRTTASRPEVYSFAARSANGMETTLVLVHRSGEEAVDVAVSVPGMPEAKASAITAVAGSGATEVALSEQNLTSSDHGWICSLPPRSMILIRLKK